MAIETHQSERGFALGAEQLRRIDQIFREELKILKYPVSDVTYSVHQLGKPTYVEIGLADVLDKPLEGDSIERVTMWYRNSNCLRCELNFSRNGIELEIEGKDEAHTSSLSSRLRESLSGVETRRYSWRRNIRTTLIFLAIALFVGSLVHSFWRTKSAAQDVMRSQDVIEKLDFLIRDTSMPFTPFEFGFMITALTALTMIFLLDDLVAKLFDFQFPLYVFAFGEEIERHKRREKRQAMIFWGVVVASIVGFLVNWLS